MGRHWLKSIAGIGDHAQAFRDAYPIVASPIRRSTADADICAHPACFACSPRWPAAPWTAANSTCTSRRPAPRLRRGRGRRRARRAVDTRATSSSRWFERLISQPPPDRDGAWTPTGWSTSSTAPPRPGGGQGLLGEGVLPRARLDWWALDVDPRRTSLEDRRRRRHRRTRASSARRCARSFRRRCSSTGCRTRAGGRSRTAG